VAAAAGTAARFGWDAGCFAATGLGAGLGFWGLGLGFGLAVAFGFGVGVACAVGFAGFAATTVCVFVVEERAGVYLELLEELVEVVGFDVD
jgi:hypothetical protein